MPITYKNREGEVEVQYEGAVLQTWERNGYHDSDFYALVFDEATNKVFSVEYASTRGAGGGYAKVDVTDETLAKVLPVLTEMATSNLTWKYEREAKTVQPGKVVRLTETFKGRKQPSAEAGEEAQVSSVFEDFYGVRWGNGPTPMKAKVTFADGREISLSTDRFEVVDWERYMPQDLAEQAAEWAARTVKSKSFRGLYEAPLYI